MRRIMAFLLTAMLLCSLAACTGDPQPATDPSAEPVSDGMLLSTPIGTLEYPAPFAANTRLESKQEDGLFSYTLYGATGTHEAPLFTVYVGERGDGRLFGYAPDSQGVMQAIYVQIQDFQGDETWTQEELELIWQMQQHVNDLIDQIYELPGFQE